MVSHELPMHLSNWDERYQKEPHNGTRGYSFHETNGTSLLVIFERPHQTKGVSSFLRSKHIMYLLLGFLSLLFISAIILIGNLNPKEPPPAHPPTPLSPSATSGIMLALGPLLTCWGISIKIRCPDRFVRRCLLTITGLFLFWILIVLLKYACAMEHQAVITFCWYYFYIPMLISPALCLICALHTAAVPLRVLRTLTTAALSISAILVVMVFTNSFHFSVFSFDYADTDWAANYTYQLGYWLVVSWQAILVIAFFITITYASRRRLRNTLAVIGVFGGLLTIYAILYILKIDVIFKSNFTLSYVLVYVLIIETCLDFGIFPSFASYRETFPNLPFDIVVLTDEPEIVYQTKTSTPPPQQVREELAEHPVSIGSFRSLTVPEFPDTRFLALGIQGGVALLAENRKEIHDLTRRITLERKALERRNELLKAEIKIKGKASYLESKLALFEEIQTALKDALEAMEAILEKLHGSKLSDNSADDREALLRLRLLIAYCKRKSSLLLAGKDEGEPEEERLALVVEELVADARASGIDCAAYESGSMAISHAALSAAYDCLYNIISSSLDLPNPTILISMKGHNGNRLVLDVILESQDHVILSSEMLPPRSFISLEAAGITHRLHEGLEGFRLSLSIPNALQEGPQ